jgi:hypothetical protein
MAEVFADDIALNYTGSAQYLALLNTIVDDAGGNNNGHLDPGETVDLTALLKNIGGADFTDLSTTIQSTDPYLSITDNSGYFGALAVDSTKENTSDPYTLSASASAPQGYTAQCQLLASDGSFADTFNFDLVIGRMHYFVWNPDPTPSSGETIDDILSSLGYSGNYSITLPITDLEYYYAVFVCVGIYSNNYVIGASSAEASALVDFVNGGGRMYLEGGDVWYYDPPYQAGYNFGPLFGINASADGSGDVGPVAGQTSTFTEGMNFTGYTGENSYIDHIDPTGTGFTIFIDTDNAYNCGVANDAGTYQTVGMSFELGGLVDGSGVSTRDSLVQEIMTFFGINLVVAEEHSSQNITIQNLKLSPNPFTHSIDISWQSANTDPACITIYDATGRAVKHYDNISLKHTKHIIWNGRDNHGNTLASGIYFVHVEVEQQRTVEKIILID